MSDFARLRTVCETAARAGAGELKAWKSKFTFREKAKYDLVTDADLASQNAIESAIRREFPDHGFLGEENPDPSQLELPYCWIVDPLDGTTNYVHDFPFYAVSVAVAFEGKLAAGAVLYPVNDECFTAARGMGSQLNGTPIRVSTAAKMSQSLIAVSFPPQPANESLDIQAFLKVSPQCRAVRRTGSAALNLAYVACGRLDAHWAHYIHSWDSAAGVLLVEEAGGVVGAFSGEPYNIARGDYCVAATRQLFDEAVKLIQPQ